jgi:hypothetical protein
MQEGARGRENREKGAGDRGPQAESKSTPTTPVRTHTVASSIEALRSAVTA